jgi:uncharacterized FlaG/YvyC family protein
MSVDPVHGYRTGGDAASSDVQPRARQTQASPTPQAPVETDVQPGSGISSKPEKTAAKVAPASSDFPPDEVQLQLDSQIRDQVIVKYTDKATGEVVLQVPSTQVLGVARGIYEDFQRQTKQRASAEEAAAVAAGGKQNGH